MQDTQTCPVCGKTQIPMDRQQCPQCNSDLTCFQVLDALIREPVEQELVNREPVNRQPVKPRWSRSVWLPVAILVVFLGMGLAWMFYQNFLIIQTVKDNRNSLEYVDRSVQTLMRKVESERERAESGKEKAKSRKEKAGSGKEKAGSGKERNVPAEDKTARFPTEGKRIVKPPTQGSVIVRPPAEGKAVKPSVAVTPPVKMKSQAAKSKEAKFFWYKTTDKDTLWEISERFYHSGRYYPVLLIMNPQVSLYEIKAGQQLKILQNQKDVITTFNRSVTKEGLCVYLWYQVRQDDTLKTLSRKFYKTDDRYSIINRVNPHLHLEPGQRIRVLLPDLS